MYGKITRKKVYNKPTIYMQGIYVEGYWFGFAESQFFPQLHTSQVLVLLLL